MPGNQALRIESYSRLFHGCCKPFPEKSIHAFVCAAAAHATRKGLSRAARRGHDGALGRTNANEHE